MASLLWSWGVTACIMEVHAGPKLLEGNLQTGPEEEAADGKKGDPKSAGKRDSGKRGTADRSQSRAKTTDVCRNYGKKVIAAVAVA